MEIIQANTLLHFEAIEQLAREILPEHYGAYLPVEHVNYFIEKFQTARSIQEQTQHGFEYYLLIESGQNAAYLGIHEQNQLLILSKLYILKQFREKGIGAKLMDFVKFRASELKLSGIELVVNKLNQLAIEFYKRKGFEITELISHEYESGYLMQEYKMTKLFK